MKVSAAALIIATTILAAPAARAEDLPVATKRATIRFGQMPRVAFGSRGMAFSPDSRLLAAGRTQTLGIALWDAATGKQVSIPEPEEVNQGEGALPDIGIMPVTGDSAAVFLPDSKTIAVADMMVGIRLVDIETGKSRKIAPPPEQDKRGKPAKNRGNPAVPNLPPQLQGMIPDLSMMGGMNYTLQCSHDGKLLAVSNAVEVSITDIGSGQRRTIATHGKSEWRATPGGVSGRIQTLPGMVPPSQLGFTSDGKHLIVGEHDGSFRVFDVKTGKLKRTLGKPGKEFGFSAMARDGSRVAIADTSGKQGIRVIDVDSGKEVRTIKVAGGIMGAPAIDLSPDGQTVAYIATTETGTNPPVLIDVNSGKVVATLGEMPKKPEKKARKPKPKPGQPAAQAMQEIPVGAVGFSPDGKTLATSTMFGGDIDLWDNPLTAAAPVTPSPGAGEPVKP